MPTLPPQVNLRRTSLVSRHLHLIDRHTALCAGHYESMLMRVARTHTKLDVTHFSFTRAQYRFCRAYHGALRCVSGTRAEASGRCLCRYTRLSALIMAILAPTHVLVIMLAPAHTGTRLSAHDKWAAACPRAHFARWLLHLPRHCEQRCEQDCACHETSCMAARCAQYMI